MKLFSFLYCALGPTRKFRPEAQLPRGAPCAPKPQPRPGLGKRPVPGSHLGWNSPDRHRAILAVQRIERPSAKVAGTKPATAGAPSETPGPFSLPFLFLLATELPQAPSPARVQVQPTAPWPATQALSLCSSFLFLSSTFFQSRTEASTRWWLPVDIS